MGEELEVRRCGEFKGHNSDKAAPKLSGLGLRREERGCHLSRLTSDFTNDSRGPGFPVHRAIYLSHHLPSLIYSWPEPSTIVIPAFQVRNKSSESSSHISWVTQPLSSADGKPGRLPVCVVLYKRRTLTS